MALMQFKWGMDVAPDIARIIPKFEDFLRQF
jgi:hypothetical protein